MCCHSYCRYLDQVHLASSFYLRECLGRFLRGWSWYSCSSFVSSTCMCLPFGSWRWFCGFATATNGSAEHDKIGSTPAWNESTTEIWGNSKIPHYNTNTFGWENYDIFTFWITLETLLLVTRCCPFWKRHSNCHYSTTARGASMWKLLGIRGK